VNDAGISTLRVADQTGFVDLFAGDPNLAGLRRFIILFRNNTWLSGLRDLAPLLRRVVFVGEPTLRLRFDRARRFGRTFASWLLLSLAGCEMINPQGER
jgi:hypothetical protein